MKRFNVLALCLFAFLLTFAQVNKKLEQAQELLSTDPVGAERIIDSITPEELAQCNDSLRVYYHYYGAAAIDLQRLYSQKKLEHLLAAKEIFETRIGLDNPLYFELMHAIGTEYEQLGDDEEALVINEEGLIKALSYFNGDNEDIQTNISILRSNIANLYRKLNREDVANYFDNPTSEDDNENLLRSERDNALVGDYEWCVASTLLANELISQNRFGEAAGICEEVYPYTKVLVEDPQGVHRAVLENLSDGSRVIGAYDKALVYLVELLSYLDKNQVGQFDPDRGWVYNKIGLSHMSLGDYDQSRESLTRAGDIIRKAYSEDSNEYATILHNLGRLAQLQGDYSQAKELYSKSIELQLKHTGQAIDSTYRYLKETNEALN